MGGGGGGGGTQTSNNASSSTLQPSPLPVAIGRYLHINYFGSAL